MQTETFFPKIAFVSKLFCEMDFLKNTSLAWVLEMSESVTTNS